MRLEAETTGTMARVCFVVDAGAAVFLVGVLWWPWGGYGAGVRMGVVGDIGLG